MMGDPRIITFDGDLYQMTVPDKETLAVLAKKHLILTPKCYAYWTSEETDQTWFYIINGEDTRLFTYARYRFQNKDGMLTARDTESQKEPLLFRPMLVPMDNNGRACCKQFQKDNPDGTIVEGGTASYDGVPMTPAASNLFSAGHTVGITDTVPEHHVLQWVCWGGRLYCMDSLIQIHIDYLEEQAALSPDLPLSKHM